MTKRLIVLLFTLSVAVPVFAESISFVCGNKDHVPSHSASTLDDAKALTKRHGCGGWHVHSPYRGNSMPIPNQAYLLQQMRLRTLSSQLDGLNEFSKATVNAIAWKQLRPENLQQQPLKIVVTSARIAGNSKRFRIFVSSAAAAPELHGYLTVASLSDDDFPWAFASTDRFVEIQRNLHDGTATYEFDVSPAQATLPSQFTLADAPLDGDGTMLKNIYWFYLKDFDNR